MSAVERPVSLVVLVLGMLQKPMVVSPFSAEGFFSHKWCHQPGRKLQGCLGFWSNEQVHVTFMGLTTTAKYFHNEEGQHAGSKVSAVLGHIPSAVGYQPTLSMDMGGMYG
ncbi:hypothetical protein EDD17DRAFT_1507719 [Pisolithus thermaeus]|nr:hypothetical protein EDD17DRAFT_1507719 [Pisolithus thermaeus]